MKVLFDNNVPTGVRHRLAHHQVVTAAQMGWGELGNGQLLRAAEEAGFDLMLTGDKNLSYQQNLRERKIALLVLGTIHWPSLEPALASVVAAVERAEPGGFEELPSPPYVAPKRR